MAKTFVILVLLCLQLLHWVSCTKLPGFSNAQRLLTLFRGGAKGKPVKKAQPISKSKRRNRYEDDENEDDYDDEEEDDRYYKSKRGKSSRRTSNRGKSSRGSFSLIPWSSASNDRESSSKKKGPSIRERLEQIAKSGQSAYKDIYRRAKVMKSSAFEGILLKATWPSDVIVTQEVLTDLIKYSIPAFKYTRSESEEDPYYMTLHKLWTKMTERDWRTVTKSLYILHCISKDSSQESCRHFATALKTLSKARNPKKPDQKYYDIKVISDLDVPSQSYQPFVKAYAAYIIHRTKTFSGKFEEFKEFLNSAESNQQKKKNNKEDNAPVSSYDIDANSFKKVIVLAKKTQQAIQQGLQVRLNKKQVNVVTGQVMKALSQDIKDLWQFYDQLVKTYLLASSPSLSQHQNRENAKEINDILAFYQDHYDVVKKYLQEHAKLFKSLKLKLPADLDEEASLSSDSVKQRIEELLKISGGSRQTVEEEEDDDDDDNDDAEEDDDEVEDEEEEGEGEDEDENNEDDADDEDDKQEAAGNSSTSKGDDEEEDEDELEEDADEKVAETEEDEESEDSAEETDEQQEEHAEDENDSEDQTEKEDEEEADEGEVENKDDDDDEEEEGDESEDQEDGDENEDELDEEDNDNEEEEEEEDEEEED